MSMNRAQILDIVKHCHLDGFIGEGNCGALIRDRLPDNFEGRFENGATKAVIIPAHESFVIKIPMNAYVEEGYDEDDEESETYITEFSEGCEDWSHCWDYCWQETLIYQKAQECHLQRAFAKTSWLGDIDYYPIYIQPKITIYANSYWDFSRGSIEDYQRDVEISTSIRRYAGCTSLPEGWAVDVYNYYGERFYKKLVSFLAAQDHINDIHSENVGYLGRRPVLCDYSGFYD